MSGKKRTGYCFSRSHFRSACRKWSRLSLGFSKIRRSPSAPAQGCESKVNISPGDFKKWDRRSLISGGRSPARSGRSAETSLRVSLAHCDSRVSLTLAIANCTTRGELRQLIKVTFNVKTFRFESLPRPQPEQPDWVNR